MNSEDLKSINDSAYYLSKPQVLKHGKKYSIHPQIHIKDLSGAGCPKKNIGWMSPVDQDAFKLLRNKFATKLGIDEANDPVSLTLYNNKFSHSEQPCYEVCYEKSKDGSICLRTWIFTHMHLTDGRKNSRVKTVPWFSFTPRTMDLSNVSGTISAVFIPNTDPNKVKFWCNVSYGEATPRADIRTEDEAFGMDEFEALSD